jgi:hypothetical protein
MEKAMKAEHLREAADILAQIENAEAALTGLREYKGEASICLWYNDRRGDNDVPIDRAQAEVWIEGVIANLRRKLTDLGVT